jgi:Bacterial Ig domain
VRASAQPLAVLAALLLGALLLSPLSAHAATPGVNLAGVPGAAQLDQAAASGAKQVRVFAQRDAFPARYADYRAIVSAARARGMGVVFVLMGASGPATDPDEFATFAGAFAGRMAQAGGAAAYEVWNEPDEPQFWGGPVDVGHYVAILRAAAPRIRRADPGAAVLLGAQTGNNYGFLGQVYDQGGRSAFDAVAVHTDTACLIEPPSSFQREAGRIGRYSFLGFRTVRDVMVANGDGGKSIWMTELGWSTATSPCARGMWAGQKPAGVPEATQAANVTEAYHCLAGYPYVQAGTWFTLTDSVGEGDELDHYGLLRADGSPKPAWDAFRRYATQGDTLTGACGDLGGPDIAVHNPTRDVRYVGPLSLSAVATDPGGVARVTFRVDGRTIRNFTGAAVASGRRVGLEWQGAKHLSLGRHVLTVVALDPHGNASSRAISIHRVTRLPATLRTRISLGAVTVGADGVATVTGRVVKSASPGLSGKVRVAWQRLRSGRWRTVHAVLRRADQPFTASRRLVSAGRWRVRASYVSRAPYRTSSAWRTLHVPG